MSEILRENCTNTGKYGPEKNSVCGHFSRSETHLFMYCYLYPLGSYTRFVILVLSWITLKLKLKLRTFFS